MSNQTASLTPNSNPQPRIDLRWVLLVALLLLGLGLRLLDLTDPPLDFHPSRQLRAAIIARGMYAEMLDSRLGAPTWLESSPWAGITPSNLDSDQRQSAINMWRSMAIYEPQIFERLVAVSYWLLGAEILWVARLYSALFWILGGIALFELARRTTSFQGGILALAFYLFLPFSVSASRSFQPDPLMVSLILWAAYSAYRWSEEKTWRWAIATGIISSLAVLIKAPAALQIGLMLTFLVLVSWGFKQAIRQPQVWLVVALSVSLPMIFYILQRGNRSSAYLDFWSTSFSDMLLEPGFYIRWLLFLQHNVMGISLFFIGLAGIALLSSRVRAIALGLWIGYGCSGLMMPYLIASHDYYSLPLVPAVALSLAPLVAPITQIISRQSMPWKFIFYATLSVALAYPVWLTRSTMLARDYRPEIIGWQIIGQELPQDEPIIAITHDYGHRLRYYGWVSVELWPSSSDQALAALRSGNPADTLIEFNKLTEGYGYFLVTLPNQLAAQPQLSEILNNNYPLLAEGSGYLLFDLNPAPNP